MEGIRLSHGGVFVTNGISTVRILKNGEVGYSPISYFVLERDLSTEPPSSWEYMTDGEIRSLPEWDKISALFEKIGR